MRSRSMWGFALVLAGILIGWLLPRSGADAEVTSSGGTLDATEPLARVGGELVTFADVRAARPGDFLRLERQRHALLEQTLGLAVRAKLIELEAEARGISQEELIVQEVDASIDEPTEEEVRAWYDERQVAGSFALAAPQIRNHLRDQGRTARHDAFVRSLLERHTVEALLEPLRSHVEADGFPSRGPDDAAVTIVEFGDFQCPYCQQLVGSLERVLEAYGDEVRFVYRHFPLSSIHPDAQKSAEASLCAHDQGMFWEMHDAMFADQDALGVPALKTTAGDLDLDRGEFDRCLDSGQHVQAVRVDRDAAVALGLEGTPGLFVNGRFFDGVQSAEVLAAVIRDELERAGRSVEPRLLTPRRSRVESEGYPSKGPADAPVTIVAFSDFQCPYCSRILPVLDQVVATYGDGVRVAFRQYPVSSLHPQAQKAAEASLCAEEQDRFWEMHDAMFADQGALAVPRLKSTARSLGLDGVAFDMCLDSGRYRLAVLADVDAGREAGVRGTPTLFINGLMGSGLQSFEALSAIIERELETADRR